MNATCRRPSFSCYVVLSCLAAAPGLASQTGLATGSAEKSGLFEYRVPAQWRGQDNPDGGRVLLPPDDSSAIVRFLLPQPWTGTPESYHESMHAALRQGALVTKGGKPQPFGGFLRSEAELGAEGGPSLRITLYTARSGERCQGILFAAPTDEAFGKHLGAVDGLVRAIELPKAPERASGFEFTLPKGWKRQDDAQGMSALTPGGVEPGTCGVVILPASAMTGTAVEHHQRLWTQLTANATPTGEPVRSERGHFRSSRARTRTEQGGEAWLILYTAQRSNSVETLYFLATTREQYEKHGPETDALVAAITFPATAPAAAGSKGPTPVPPRDVAMTGLWIRGATGFEYGMDPGGTFSTQLRSQIEVLALWENGIAYRGMHDAQVMAAKGLMSVREGLAVVDAAALAAQAKMDDDRYSRWTEQEGVIDIPANRRGPLQLRRQGMHLAAQDGSKWIRLAPVDGARLQGTFARAASPSAPEMSLTFGVDGSFAAANVIHVLGGPTNNPDFPMQGVGTYEFRKWSLILRFAGGFTQTIQFLGNGEQLASAKALVLAGAEFVRR